METLTALIIPIAAGAAAVGLILWIKRQRRKAGKRDDETQPLGPEGF